MVDFNLDLGTISSIIGNMATLKKGANYLSEGRVKQVYIDQKDYRVKGEVLGNYLYDVVIDFDSDWDFDDAYCTCPAYEDYGDYCKHIAAVLIKLSSSSYLFSSNNSNSKVLSHKQRAYDIEVQKNNQAVQGIFNFFQSYSPSHQGVAEVNLEITIEYEVYGSSIVRYLTFRIGDEKLYIVKSVDKLISCLYSGYELEFGKQFTFNPRIHSFKEEDRPLVNMLKELYEVEQLKNNNSYGFYRSDNKVFIGKQVLLSNIFAKRFFDIMAGRSFRFILNGRNYDCTIKEEDLPITLSISKDNQDLVLKIDKNEDMIPLTDGGEYFFYRDSIYKISKKQNFSFVPFYSAMSSLKKDTIKFDKENSERFISEVLPLAKGVGAIEIDKKVEESFYNVPLQTEVYIDREDRGVTAEIKFKYGDRTVNPFGNKTRDAKGDERILIRDIEKERIILSFFEKEDFKVMPNKLYIEDEEQIFDFIYNSLPKLQQEAEIFYSEKFKSAPIRDISSFKGGIRLNQDNDLLEFNFDMEGIDRNLYQDIFASIREKRKFFKLPDGSFLPLDSKELAGIADIVDYLDLDRKDFEKEVIRISKYRASYIDDKIKDLGLNNLIERNTKFKELVQNINEPKDMEFVLPEGLKNILRDYQRTGFKWFKTLNTYGLGGILADDMGLGKTLQTIAFLKSELEDVKEPSLIVAPTSLIYNWKAEIEKFSPDIKSLVISGDKGEREELFKLIGESDIVITSYPLIRRDIDSYKEIKFSYCILDEAQHIKNPNSLNAKSVKEIAASNYFALTGTPIENSLTELWSIFDFVMPGYLLSHGKFHNKFEKPIVKNQDRAVMEELKKHIRPFILRRIKKDVLKELPDKVEHPVMAELNKEQKKLYLAYLNKIKEDIDQEIKDKGFERSHIKILAGMTRLRQICCHPSMFIEDYHGYSGKMELLEEIISEAIGGGHRILLFSQFTTMLKIIKDRITSLGYSYMYLDGTTDVEDRGRLVNEFNGGKGQIFLISLKAGGTGLNLIGADTVIHFDPWWNPAVEEQATDRAHRIGQKKSVHVMKLIAKGTIEEKIYQLQQKKREMIQDVINPGETLLTKLKEEEIRELFDIR